MAVPAIIWIVNVYVDFVKFLTSKIFDVPFKWTYHEILTKEESSPQTIAVFILLAAIGFFCILNDAYDRPSQNYDENETIKSEYEGVYENLQSEYDNLHYEYSILQDEYRSLRSKYDGTEEEYQNTLSYLCDEWGYIENCPRCCICGDPASTFFYNENTDEFFCVKCVSCAFESPYFSNTITNFIKNN